MVEMPIWLSGLKKINQRSLGAKISFLAELRIQNCWAFSGFDIYDLI